MRRRLFDIAVMLSLVAFAAVAAIWARSYFVQDQLTRWDDWDSPLYRKTRIFMLYANRGHFVTVCQISWEQPDTESGPAAVNQMGMKPRRALMDRGETE
jgi:hypothetical protein